MRISTAVIARRISTTAIAGLLLGLHAAAANATVMTFGAGAALDTLGYTEAGMSISGVSFGVAPRIDDWTASGEREMLPFWRTTSKRIRPASARTFSARTEALGETP